MTFSRHLRVLSDSPPPTPVHPPPAPVPAWLRALVPVLKPFLVLTAWLAAALHPAMRRMHGAPWRLAGACRSCGRCCHTLAMPWPVSHEGRDPATWVDRAALHWYEAFWGFYPKPTVYQADDTEGVRFFGCRHLGADNKCDTYRTRPLVCRLYPALDLHLRPEPRPWCGYRVEDR